MAPIGPGPVRKPSVERRRVPGGRARARPDVRHGSLEPGARLHFAAVAQVQVEGQGAAPEGEADCVRGGRPECLRAARPPEGLARRRAIGRRPVAPGHPGRHAGEVPAVLIDPVGVEDLAGQHRQPVRALLVGQPRQVAGVEGVRDVGLLMYLCVCLLYSCHWLKLLVYKVWLVVLCVVNLWYTRII